MVHVGLEMVVRYVVEGGDKEADVGGELFLLLLAPVPGSLVLPPPPPSADGWDWSRYLMGAKRERSRREVKFEWWNVNLRQDKNVVSAAPLGVATFKVMSARSTGSWPC